jgi:hypothetical protein
LAGCIICVSQLTGEGLGAASTSNSCPGRLEDPAHYVLECAGLTDIRALHPAVVAAAATVTSVGAQLKSPRGLCSVRPNNFAEVVNCLLLAKRRWFAAEGGEHVLAVAAGLAWRGPNHAATIPLQTQSVTMQSSPSLP